MVYKNKFKKTWPNESYFYVWRLYFCVLFKKKKNEKNTFFLLCNSPSLWLLNGKTKSDYRTIKGVICC